MSKITASGRRDGIDDKKELPPALLLSSVRRGKSTGPSGDRKPRAALQKDRRDRSWEEQNP
jgi:hypothetical protein